MEYSGLPALPAITAKVLVLLEKVLDCFVTVGYLENAAWCCKAGFWNGATTTVCGDELVSQFTALLLTVTELASSMLAALMVQIY